MLPVAMVARSFGSLRRTSVSEAGVIAERMRQRVTEPIIPSASRSRWARQHQHRNFYVYEKNRHRREGYRCGRPRSYHAKAEGKNRSEFT